MRPSYGKLVMRIQMGTRLISPIKVYDRWSANPRLLRAPERRYRAFWGERQAVGETPREAVVALMHREMEG